MKNDDNDLKQQIALFPYGLIADIVRLEPGTRNQGDLRQDQAKSHA